jgi:hypothetical protein
MASLQKKSLDNPDEVRTFEKGKVEIATLGDVIIGRATLEPGWSWEKCVKPLVNSNSCEAPHTSYIVSGRMTFSCTIAVCAFHNVNSKQTEYMFYTAHELDQNLYFRYVITNLTICWVIP